MNELMGFSLLRRRNVPGRRRIDRDRRLEGRVSVSYGEETSRDYDPWQCVRRGSDVSVSYGEETSRDCNVNVFYQGTDKVSVSYGEETSRDFAGVTDALSAFAVWGFSLLRRRNVPGLYKVFINRVRFTCFSLLRRRNVPGQDISLSIIIMNVSVSVSYGEETSRDLMARLAEALGLFQSPTEKKRPGTMLKLIADVIASRFSLLRRRNVPGLFSIRGTPGAALAVGFRQGPVRPASSPAHHTRTAAGDKRALPPATIARVVP